MSDKPTEKAKRVYTKKTDADKMLAELKQWAQISVEVMESIIGKGPEVTDRNTHMMGQVDSLKLVLAKLNGGTK